MLCLCCLRLCPAKRTRPGPPSSASTASRLIWSLDLFTCVAHAAGTSVTRYDLRNLPKSEAASVPPGRKWSPQPEWSPMMLHHRKLQYELSRVEGSLQYEPPAEGSPEAGQQGHPEGHERHASFAGSSI